MNQEICKNCKCGIMITYDENKKISYLECINIPSRFSAYTAILQNLNFLLDIQKQELYLNKAIGIKAKLLDSSIQINKNCPYYIEHELYDWSKEK